MSAIIELQNWYLSQCNDDWEHTYGIEIGTLDNPGWSLLIDLSDTDLGEVSYPETSYGIGDSAESSGNDWVVTKIESGKFIGYGGPHKLEELISIFLVWAKSNA